MEIREKSVFIETFGASPLLRILDFLVVNEEFDYSMKDIAELSGAGYSTLKLFWSRLAKDKIIIQTRAVGKAKMYKLNLANPAMKLFKDFYWKLMRQKVHELTIEKAVNA